MPHKILHVIIGLDAGGAELMLARLVVQFADHKDFKHSVVSLTTLGSVGEKLRKLGVEVHTLEMDSPFYLPRTLARLVKRIYSSSPNLVQTWMYHADLLGGIAARMAGCRSVVWGIRGSAIPQVGVSMTEFIVRLCSLLSHYLPTIIVCCANAARDAHIRKGYDQAKMVVIQNGFDVNEFNATTTDRLAVRSDLGFHPTDMVVGVVGRYDPLKDYKTFIEAAGILASRFPQVKFLMVGKGLTTCNRILMDLVVRNKIQDSCRLVGERSDVARCLGSMDIFCLSSSKEGFPNVVCEAMAMKLPCVVTNAGDAAQIVGETGLVVEPNSPRLLALGLETMLRKSPRERQIIGEQARDRVELHYSIKRAAQQFEELYIRVLNMNQRNQT